jgi:hypothetical protein
MNCFAKGFYTEFIPAKTLEIKTSPTGLEDGLAGIQ